MAVRHGYGKVATNGLVFAYDTGDTVNSYKGEPTENLIPNPYFIDGNGNPTVSGYGTFGFSHDNTIAATSLPSAIGNGYSARVVKNTTTNGTIVESVTIPALNTGDTVVVSWYAKGYGGSESQTCQTHCYVNSSGGAVSTGTFSTVTSEWKRFYHVLTWTKEVPSNTSANSYFYSGFGTGTEFQVANPQVEVYKAHPTQFVNGTRSVSGSLLDLTGLGGLDLTNVSFDSNAQIDFDGTGDYFDVEGVADFQPNNTTDGFTVEFVYKLDTVSAAVFVGNLDSTNGWFQAPISTSGIGAYLYLNGSPGVVLNTDVNFRTNSTNINKYHHVVMCLKWNDAANSFIMIDGVDKTNSRSNVSKQSTSGIPSPGLRIGKRGSSVWPTNGQIPVVKYYNRALTADEVRNNYRHYKNRFNI